MFDKELYFMELERLLGESVPREMAEGILKYMAYDGAVGFAIMEQLHDGALEDLADEYFYGYCYRKIHKGPDNEIEDIVYKGWIDEWMSPKYILVPRYIAEGLKIAVHAFGKSNPCSKYINDVEEEYIRAKRNSKYITE